MKTSRSNENQRLCSTFALLWKSEFPGRDYIISGRDRKAAKELLEGGQEIQTSEILSRFRQYMKDPYWRERNFPAHAFFHNFSDYAGSLKGSGPSFGGVISCSLCGKDHHMNAPCDLGDIPLQEGGTLDTVREALDLLAKRMSVGSSRSGG